MRAEITAVGLGGIARYWARVADHAADLRPAGWLIRERWHESERRVFRARRGWAPRAASTLQRYRYPVRRWRRGGRRGRGRGPLRHPSPGAVGVYTGQMHVALTRPHQPGVRDSIVAGRGGLTAIFGVRRRGVLAHANLFHQGAGSRPPRPVVVFDDEAHADATADVLDWLEGLRGSARRR